MRKTTTARSTAGPRAAPKKFVYNRKKTQKTLHDDGFSSLRSASDSVGARPLRIIYSASIHEPRTLLSLIWGFSASRGRRSDRRNPAGSVLRARPLGISETSLRFRSSTSAFAIRIVFASASWISTDSAVSLRTIPVRMRPSTKASVLGSYPDEILAEGKRTAAISSSRGYFAPTLESSGPDRASLLADRMALDARQALRIAEQAPAPRRTPLPF